MEVVVVDILGGGGWRRLCAWGQERRGGEAIVSVLLTQVFFKCSPFFLNSLV